MTYIKEIHSLDEELAEDCLNKYLEEFFENSNELFTFLRAQESEPKEGHPLNGLPGTTQRSYKAHKSCLILRSSGALMRRKEFALLSLASLRSKGFLNNSFCGAAFKREFFGQYPLLNECSREREAMFILCATVPNLLEAVDEQEGKRLSTRQTGKGVNPSSTRVSLSAYIKERPASPEVSSTRALFSPVFWARKRLANHLG